MSKYAKLYKSKLWLKLREAHLAQQPLCVMCQAKGDITPAEVVDHIKRHHGCWQRFSDPNNLQSLCKRHHDSDKQHEEWLETLPSAVGIDGYPLEKRW